MSTWPFACRFAAPDARLTTKELRRSFWQYRPVTNFLAAAADTGSGFDWSILATPSGVVLGALIAGSVAWRNSRKSVYERLELLAKARKDWPEGLDGAETLDQSIALALAEVRKREKHDAAVTPAEKQADREVSERWNREHRLSLVGVIVAVAATVIGFVATILAPAQTDTPPSSGWASIAVTLVTLIVAAFAAFVAFRRR